MKYISLYRRHFVNGNEIHDSLIEAVDFLQCQEEEGNIMPIAVIHNGKMVWYKEFLGKDTCQNQVDSFNASVSKP